MYLYLMHKVGLQRLAGIIYSNIFLWSPRGSNSFSGRNTILETRICVWNISTRCCRSSVPSVPPQNQQVGISDEYHAWFWGRETRI